MNHGIRRVAVGAAIAASLAIGCAATAQADTAHHGHHHPAVQTWQTCTPGSKDYRGAYRDDDNAWAGPSSKHFCVHSTGLNISIDSNAIANVLLAISCLRPAPRRTRAGQPPGRHAGPGENADRAGRELPDRGDPSVRGFRDRQRPGRWRSDPADQRPCRPRVPGRIGLRRRRVEGSA
jgi:hypothetical protein